jgi:hypothetical protein
MKNKATEVDREVKDKEINEYFRKKIHVFKTVLDRSEASHVMTSTGELNRSFKLALSKKLALNEGEFKNTKVKLYK